jgi:hypothetical protein
MKIFGFSLTTILLLIGVYWLGTRKVLGGFGS